MSARYESRDKPVKRTQMRKDRKTCKRCWKRPAIFIRRATRRNKKKTVTRLGRRMIVKTDRMHDLCQQCRRAMNDSLRNSAEWRNTRP